MLGGVQRAHHQAAGPEDDGAGQHEAQQRDRQLLLWRREAWGQQRADERFSAKGCCQTQGNQHQRDQVEHLARRGARPSGGRCFARCWQRWDEGAAQRPPCCDLKEQIGDTEGGQIGIVVGGCSETGPITTFAVASPESRLSTKEHDQQGSARHAAAVQPGSGRSLGNGCFV
jgi:hypothetical protein